MHVTLGSDFKIVGGFDVVLLGATAMIILRPDQIGRIAVVWCGTQGAFKVFRCPELIVVQAPTIKIKHPDIVNCASMVGLCGIHEPFGGFFVIGGASVAAIIQQPQRILRTWVVILRRQSPLRTCHFIITRLIGTIS